MSDGEAELGKMTDREINIVQVIEIGHVRVEVAELKGKLEAIERGLCPVGAHADHETRIRGVEEKVTVLDTRNKVIAWGLGIGVPSVTGVIVAALMVLLKGG